MAFAERFVEMPDDVLAEVLRNFDPLAPDFLLSLGAVCARWRERIDPNDALWRTAWRGLLAPASGAPPGGPASPARRAPRARRACTARLPAGKGLLVRWLRLRRANADEFLVQFSLLVDGAKLTLAALRRLLRRWAPLDVDRQSAASETALTTLVASATPPHVSLACARELVGAPHRADVNLANDLSFDALQCAAALGKARLVEFLLASGADATARGAHPNGFIGAPSPRPGQCERTAREWAELYGHAAVVATIDAWP